MGLRMVARLRHVDGRCYWSGNLMFSSVVYTEAYALAVAPRSEVCRPIGSVFAAPA